MLGYVAKRFGYMLITLFVVSIVSFVIIQLPPGDFATTLVSKMQEEGSIASEQTLHELKLKYGIGEPLPMQYFRWISGIVLRGDFGMSFEWDKPVSELLWERFWITVAISIVTLMFTWLLAFPIGIYSAVKQYSAGDYVFTTIGFLGLAIPEFLLALLLMWVMYSSFDISTWGLFSQALADAPWSLAKVWDLISHMWIPVIVVGTAGTAGLIRTIRANLLDELQKPYVVTALAKGLSPNKVLLKYPLRVALNPFISTIGWHLPRLVSGTVVVAAVLNLPTIGPVFLRALMNQDMYLAGSFVLMLSALTIIGTFISDLLLAWADPRIRYE